jgi:hypothetical protein
MAALAIEMLEEAFWENVWKSVEMRINTPPPFCLTLQRISCVCCCLAGRSVTIIFIYLQSLLYKRCSRRACQELLSFWTETLEQKRKMVKPYLTKPARLSTSSRSPGHCFLCGALATTEAWFKGPDVTIVERYCDKCLPKAQH